MKETFTLPPWSFGTSRISVRGVSTAKFGSVYYLRGPGGGVRDGVDRDEVRGYFEKSGLLERWYELERAL